MLFFVSSMLLHVVLVYFQCWISFFSNNIQPIYPFYCELMFVLLSVFCHAIMNNFAYALVHVGKHLFRVHTEKKGFLWLHIVHIFNFINNIKLLSKMFVTVYNLQTICRHSSCYLFSTLLIVRNFVLSQKRGCKMIFYFYLNFHFPKY